jgi:hypothetical protein
VNYVSYVSYLTFTCGHVPARATRAPHEIYVGYRAAGLCSVVAGLRACGARCASQEIRRMMDTTHDVAGAAA